MTTGVQTFITAMFLLTAVAALGVACLVELAHRWARDQAFQAARLVRSAHVTAA